MDKILKNYILNNIKSKYKCFDKGHSISHFNFVTTNCVNYAKQLNKKGNNIDLDIAYIVGAYHDIGLVNGRENHAINSGNIVRNDPFLQNYYSKDIIEMIAQAVEDHSSHLTYIPRSIYGKIVADADRNNTKYLVFSRPIKYGMKADPKDLNKQEKMERVYDFVQQKFGRKGYVKYHLDISDVTKAQKEIWALLDNKKLCMTYIEGIFDEVTRDNYKSSKIKKCVLYEEDK